MAQTDAAAAGARASPGPSDDDEARKGVVGREIHRRARHSLSSSRCSGSRGHLRRSRSQSVPLLLGVLRHRLVLQLLLGRGVHKPHPEVQRDFPGRQHQPEHRQQAAGRQTVGFTPRTQLSFISKAKLVPIHFVACTRLFRYFQIEVTPSPVRGHPLMMSPKFLDFWTPSPLPLSLSHARNLSVLSSRFF